MVSRMLYITMCFYANQLLEELHDYLWAGDEELARRFIEN